MVLDVLQHSFAPEGVVLPLVFLQALETSCLVDVKSPFTVLDYEVLVLGVDFSFSDLPAELYVLEQPIFALLESLGSFNCIPQLIVLLLNKH